MPARIAVLQFPGSNADWDALSAARYSLGLNAYYVFHKDTDLGAGQGTPDGVIIPGGFSYGDYLRAGAIACYSPIVPALVDFANGGGPVLGICNGFQILTELQLLPGTLTRNRHLRFSCRDVHVRVEATGKFTASSEGDVLRLPIAHAEGRYQCSDEVLAALVAEERVAFRYCNAAGDRPPRQPSKTPGTVEGRLENPNGSVDDIAGIYNAQRNVLGLMPHPERAADALLGNDDGRRILEAFQGAAA